MSIAEKLQQIITIKEAIRKAIIGKGVDCSKKVKFESYPSLISQIVGGEAPAPAENWGFIMPYNLIGYQDSGLVKFETYVKIEEEEI